MKSAVKSEDLADVTAQDLKRAPYTLILDKSQLITDELAWSKAWMNANLTGLGGGHSVHLTWAAESGIDGYNVYRSATSGGPYSKIAGPLTSPQYTDYAVNPQQVWYYVVTSLIGTNESNFSSEISATVPGTWVYVYPGSFEDSSTEATAVAAGFAGARGSGVMQPSPSAATVLSSGINVQNILSQGMVPNFQNLSDAQLANKLRALTFKSAAWGVPMGLFFQVRYRGSGRAIARVLNQASIDAYHNGNDDGVRGAIRHISAPAPRTSADCENAALALLDDATGPAWSGEYETWSDFLPGNASDIFPGDALNVHVPSRGAAFHAIVRQIQIDVKDLAGEHSKYKIAFATDAAQPLAFDFDSGNTSLPVNLPVLTTDQVGSLFLADLTTARIAQLPTSTSVTIDAGVAPPPGGGIEVRWSDSGWGPDNDRNLVGRFSTQTFTVLRLGSVQNYFLRQYDASSPTRYSRYSAALHLNYPL